MKVAPFFSPKKAVFAFFLCFYFALNQQALPQVVKQYQNPILAGFYPDPSICRVGNNYYLVNSTFAYYPALPIFQSTDLVNWKQISNVQSRLDQFNFDGLGVSRGIFAPTIRYHKGTFYVTCTLVDGKGNFIVTSRNPAGPWSDPIWLPQVNGIDPSLFFDDNGKAYLIYNSIPPDNKPLYDGHRTIRMYAFDVQQLAVTGEETILVNGGTDISKKPSWIEGPHIFKKDGFYYLIAAQGGTGYDHSQVAFRSRQVTGPYVPYEHNPILTQRKLDQNRNWPITSTGHADLVQLPNGDWWAVFLGCRPYKPFDQDYYNTGRETFLAPIRWKDGWPIINPDHEVVQYRYPAPKLAAALKPAKPTNGNFQIRDNFDKPKLDWDWLFLRNPRTSWYSLAEKAGHLTVEVRPEDCSQKINPSFIGRRQQHLFGSASTSFQFSPTSANEKVGMLIFQNEEHFYFLCKSIEAGQPVVQLYRSANGMPPNQMELLATQNLPKESAAPSPLFLKIEAKGDTYSFFYALQPTSWTLLKDKVEAKFLSTKEAGGFVGCLYALYATSLGKTSTNKAHFDWFDYTGSDEVYK
ncbi:glycoside hydrolase family 43 protein [Tellurirhabdus bombi]|uniref:glycoside hydrolase family 43 protein n=1 Tax=Tellurirhabdus bombi TaxID=2907205 RepID=UPI001F3F5DF5|nr:glycoside hydrolase family 43 protein [Tellurirhabdus bombi]